MDKIDIVIASSYHPDIQKDIDGLVCRIAGIGKRNPLIDRLEIVINAENKVIDFIENSGEIWADTSREDLQKNQIVMVILKLSNNTRNYGLQEKMKELGKKIGIKCKMS